MSQVDFITKSTDKASVITTHNSTGISSSKEHDISQVSNLSEESEYEKYYEKFMETRKGLHAYKPISPELIYLEENVFPILLPILEKTIFKARKMECLKHQKSIFNGIDYISQLLWNTNPKYPERMEKHLNIFLMPWTQEWLREHPRPIFPKSWLWSKNTAAIKIQSFVRGYFVRRRAEVQELRNFWVQIKTHPMVKPEENKQTSSIEFCHILCQ